MNAKQYTRLIKSFFKSHALINTVKSGNQFNFNAKIDIIYPVANVEFLKSGVRDNNKTYQYLITVADKFDPNLEDSEEDIYSDCGEVCEDIITFFANQEGDFIIDENANIEKFNNGHTDKVCGRSFVLIFNEDNLSNACAIPTK